MMSKGYTNIQDWMLELDIDVYETIILAVIYGFSQDGTSVFSGSQNYLARKAKCQRNKVAKALKHLVELGVIEKIDKVINGVKLCDYRVLLDAPCICEIQGLYPKNTEGCIQGIHHNIVYNNIDNNNNIYTKDEKFNFKKSLINLGVTEAVAEAWLQVRKTKKATNTEIAFNRIKKEIELSGLPADKAITMAVENSWQGFKAEWPQHKTKQPQIKESTFEHNLKVMDEVCGTNYHEQAYGRHNNK